MVVLGPNVGVMPILWGYQYHGAANNNAIVLPTSQRRVAILLV